VARGRQACNTDRRARRNPACRPQWNQINTIRRERHARVSGRRRPSSLASSIFRRDVAVARRQHLPSWTPTTTRVRRTRTDGIITTVAGTAVNPRRVGRRGTAARQRAAKMKSVARTRRSPTAVFSSARVVHAAHFRYVGTGGNHHHPGGDRHPRLRRRRRGGPPRRHLRLRRLTSPLRRRQNTLDDGPAPITASADRGRFARSGASPISPYASEDARTLRLLRRRAPLRTRDTRTGSIRYQFGYDVTGPVDNNHRRQRQRHHHPRATGNGNPTSIVAPGGQQTKLTVGWPTAIRSRLRTRPMRSFI